MNNNQEIKRLLKLSQQAQDKVNFNHNGSKLANPQQQSVATRYYNKAYNLKGNMSPIEFAQIHRQIIQELQNVSN